MPLIYKTIDLLPPGKLSQGTTEIPFRFPLKSQRENRPLYETYHGVFVNINYVLKCELKRSFLAKSVTKVQEFIILTKPIERPTSKDIKFSITPDTLRKNAKERIQIPRFHITGRLNDTIACMTKPLIGHLMIQHSEVPIKSIDIQLVRVETCGCAEGYSRDGMSATVLTIEHWMISFLLLSYIAATEIQNIQVADGNVCPMVNIPIHMIFPRLFSCPTLLTENNFKVGKSSQDITIHPRVSHSIGDILVPEFELNLIVIFKDEYLVTENFQLNLIRCEC